MAVSDEALILVVTILVNFLLLQSKNNWFKRILGHLFLLLIGLTAYYVMSIDKPWGILISFIAIIVFIVDLVT